MGDERRTVAVDLDGAIHSCTVGIERAARAILEATGTEPDQEQIATTAAILATATAERIQWHAIRAGVHPSRLAELVERTERIEGDRCEGEALEMEKQRQQHREQEARAGN